MLSPPDSTAETSPPAAVPGQGAAGPDTAVPVPNAPTRAATATVGIAPGSMATGLGRRDRMVLAAVAALLALLLFWLRGGLHPAAPLERLARQSPDLTTALTDGRPTLVEFYADWCEACRSMAPAMEAIEQTRRGALDVVLLNVDNPRWQPEVDRYAVNGIPQLELFDADGRSVGRSIGARRPEELEALTTALLERSPLPQLVGVGATSSLGEATNAIATASSTGSGESADPAAAPESTSADSPPLRQPSRRAVIGPLSHG